MWLVDLWPQVDMTLGRNIETTKNLCLIQAEVSLCKFCSQLKCNYGHSYPDYITLHYITLHYITLHYITFLFAAVRLTLKVMKSSLIVSLFVICCAQDEALQKAIEGALVNKSSNLFMLQQILYPYDAIRTTATITIGPCDVTVQNITTPFRIFNDNEKDAFVRCTAYCDYEGYCLNISGSDIYPTLDFVLSDSTTSNSQSKLLDYFISESVATYLMANEGVSFYLYNKLTFSQLKGYGDPVFPTSIYLSIDNLKDMPTYGDVIEQLEYILSWVGFSMTRWHPLNCEY